MTRPALRSVGLLGSVGLLWVAAQLSGCGGSFGVGGGFERAHDSERGRAAAGRMPIRWTRRLAPEYGGTSTPAAAIVRYPGDLLGRAVHIERAVPALDPMGNRIYVGSSAGALWALTSTGTPLWSYQAGGAIGSQPFLDTARNQLYVASDDGFVHALVASTGESRWRAELGGAVGRPPVASEDAIYVITDADLVVAFDRSTGDALWRYRREAPEGFYVTEHAGLTLLERQLITAFTDGTVVALDPRDGSILWERDTASDLPESDTIRFTDVDTTPLVIGDTVYVASFAGGLYALERTSGSVRWIRDELTGIVGLARADDDVLIASSGDLGVLALRAEDGEQIWRNEIERGAPTAPIVVGDLVIVGESEGGLITLTRSGGIEVGRIEAGHGFAAPAEVAHGLGGAMSNSGTLFVFGVL